MVLTKLCISFSIRSSSSAQSTGSMHSRRFFAKSSSPTSNAVQTVPTSSTAGKPSFRPRKLPPGRKRIPEQYLLPADEKEKEKAKQFKESSAAEDEEYSQWLSGLDDLNKSLKKDVVFSKSVKQNHDEADKQFVEKFLSESPAPESILPAGFFKTQQEIAHKTAMSIPLKASLNDEYVQRMRHQNKKEDLMIDSEGLPSIFGFRVPGEYAGFYEDPKGYRQEKAKAFEEKLQKLRARNRKKKKLVSTWRVDPEQPQFTRRQLRVASKIKTTLEDVIDNFIEKHAPLLLSDGGIDIRDVEVTKDMRTATVIWESQMPEQDVKKFLERHLKVLRYDLTQALQPHKWSPEIVLKSVAQLEKEKAPERQQKVVEAELKKHIEELEKEITDTKDPLAEKREKRIKEKILRKSGAAQLEKLEKQREDHITKVARQMARNLIAME